MSNIEIPRPDYPFDMEAVLEHQAAITNLAAAVDGQNIAFTKISEFADPEIRSIIHQELHARQLGAVAETSLHRIAIPNELIIRRIAAERKELDERLRQFGTVERAREELDARIKRTQVEVTLGELLLGGDVKSLQALQNTRAENAAARLQRMDLAYSFAFGEFATRVAAIEGLAAAYTPPDFWSVEPQIPEPAQRQPKQVAPPPAKPAPLAEVVVPTFSNPDEAKYASTPSTHEILPFFQSEEAAVPATQATPESSTPQLPLPLESHAQRIARILLKQSVGTAMTITEIMDLALPGEDHSRSSKAYPAVLQLSAFVSNMAKAGTYWRINAYLPETVGVQFGWLKTGEKRKIRVMRTVDRDQVRPAEFDDKTGLEWPEYPPAEK